MSKVIVVGSQWGDEGKGKIVDWLSSEAEVVVRFQGGHNAGHTLVIDKKTYKLSLLPSGVVRGIRSIIGNGVVIDINALLEEIKKIKHQNIKINKEVLAISENATLILPYHKELDLAREHFLSGTKIGTTGRGIGPAYEDRVGRRAIRICDLFDKELLKERLKNALLHHNLLRKGLGLQKIELEKLILNLTKVAKKIKPYITSIWQELDEHNKNNKKILFEGAQGIMLDIDHGTYPFVTSSNTVSAQAAIGSGMGGIKSCFTLGITKAYVTRVGEGPFPTEEDNAIGKRIGEIGNEFGTVTGRKRRVGWFDAVMLKQAVKIGGIEGIALTKLDILDSFEKIKICTSYKVNGKLTNNVPPALNLKTKIIPIYEEMDGWLTKTKGIKSWDKLPENAKLYVKKIERLIDIPIIALSTSPERDDTILFKDPFNIN